MSKRHRLSVIQVKVLEFNQLIKSLFQVMSPPKPLTKAQASFAPTLLTLTRVSSEITMKTECPSSQIFFHPKPEPISIQKNGQDAVSSESMTDMAGHSAQIF